MDERTISLSRLLMSVANFDLYDREELADELGKTDPNDRNALLELFDTHRRPFFDLADSKKQIPLIVSALQRALSSPEFDAKETLEIAYRDGHYDGTADTIYLPYQWKFSNARVLFEESYRWLYCNFHETLKESDVEPIEPSLLGIPPIASN